jgi:membrane dipeptidase
LNQNILRIAASAALALAMTGCASAPPTDPQRLAALHERLLTFDAHVDVSPDFATEKDDPAIDGKGQLDLPKLERGKLDGAALAVWVSQQNLTADEYAKAIAQGRQKREAILRFITRHPDRLGQARTADEAEAIVKSGKHFIVLSMLNVFALGPDLSLLDEYDRAGLRLIGFTHAGHNAFADSSRPRPGEPKAPNGGLSPLGKQLVAEANRRGVILDVSQITDEAAAQVIALSKAPVIASHSALRSVRDSPRNLTDDQLRAIARKRGVVHIVAFSGYLMPAPPDLAEKAAALASEYGVKPDGSDAGKLPEDKRREFQRRSAQLQGAGPKATLKDYVDVIDRAVTIAGIDHVGISSDFNHGGGVAGWMNVGESGDLTAELAKRGYSERDIAKLWGGNFLRVWRAVEREAARERKQAAR